MSHALIIDDDTKNLGVLKQLLELEGIDYTAIADTTQLESKLNQLGRVDIVLLDLEMPDVDGYAVFDLLKGRKEFANVPIVACTVHTTEVQAARNIGFHSFISKPLNVDQFPRQIADILSGKAVWQLQ